MFIILVLFLVIRVKNCSFSHLSIIKKVLLHIHSGTRSVMKCVGISYKTIYSIGTRPHQFIIICKGLQRYVDNNEQIQSK